MSKKTQPTKSQAALKTLIKLLGKDKKSIREIRDEIEKAARKEVSEELH